MNVEEELRRLQMQINDLRVRTNNMGNNHAWINGSWQKQPLLLGYSDVLRARASNTDLSTGYNALTLGPVPSGELWVLTSISVLYAGGSVSGVTMYIVLSDGTTLWSEHSITSAKYYNFPGPGPVILEPGESILLHIYGAIAVDDDQFHISGWIVETCQ